LLRQIVEAPRALFSGGSMNSRLYPGLALVGVAAMATAASLALAQKAPADDTAFVQKAAIAGMTEVQASKIALEKSTDANVKSFAQHMIDDHTKAGDALKAAAMQEGLSVPNALDTEHKQVVDKLSGLSGANFDKAYKTQMLADHKEAVALFSNESRDSAQTAVDKFAADTLPTLQSHLKMAQDLQSK
jgi:putative membrane protein